MLALFCSLALLASYASATIVIQTPTNATSGEPLTVTWSSQMGDPSSFSMELSNPDQFHQALAVGNNLDTSSGQLSFTMPIVPAVDGYTLQAVNISNINQVFGQSGDFAITPAPSSSLSSSASSTGSNSPASTIAPGSTSSTTPFGVTNSPTSSPSLAGSSSSSGSSSGSGSSPAPTPFNGSGSNNSAVGGASLGWMTWVLTGAAAVFGGILAL